MQTNTLLNIFSLPFCCFSSQGLAKMRKTVPMSLVSNIQCTYLAIIRIHWEKKGIPFTNFGIFLT